MEIERKRKRQGRGTKKWLPKAGTAEPSMKPFRQNHTENCKNIKFFDIQISRGAKYETKRYLDDKFNGTVIY